MSDAKTDRVCQIEDETFKLIYETLSQHFPCRSITVDQIMQTLKVGINHNKQVIRARLVAHRYRKTVDQMTVEQREKDLVRKREWYYRQKQRKSSTVLAA